jgi:hypothetical protein
MSYSFGRGEGPIQTNSSPKKNEAGDTHQTNGIHFNALDRQRLKRIRYEGDEQTTPQEVTAA